MKENNIRSGFNSSRVVHIHPSLFCNLFCKHCYSSSGPKIKEHLKIEPLQNALKVLRKEGYEVLSLSGGEPLLYKHIASLLREGAKLGFRINLISNGGPINNKTIQLLKEYVDFVAISLDGEEETHNFLRNNPNAFNMAKKGIVRLVKAGIKTGIAYSMSSLSLSGMPWAIEFAEEMGCQLIQFHPFAPIGRGKLMPELTLNKSEIIKGYTIANLLKDFQQVQVHIDLLPVDHALAQKADYQILAQTDAIQSPLSDFINPIIITPTGELLPFCYGITKDYSIGNLESNLDEAILEWKKNRWIEAKKLIENAFSNLANHPEEYIDWFVNILEVSKLRVLARV